MLESSCSVFKDINKLSDRLASDILDAAKTAIRLSNSFKIVLTGGNSILKTYEILSNSESDWSKWHIYLSDERCLPLEDKDRNDYMINSVWLEHSPILKHNINFIPAELGVNGVSHYENILNGVDNFDPIPNCFTLSARGKRCIANSTACNASATSPRSV